MCVYVCVCIDACVCVCVCVSAYACVHVCALMYMCMSVCLFVWHVMSTIQTVSTHVPTDWNFVEKTLQIIEWSKDNYNWFHTSPADFVLQCRQQGHIQGTERAADDIQTATVPCPQGKALPHFQGPVLHFSTLFFTACQRVSLARRCVSGYFGGSTVGPVMRDEKALTERSSPMNVEVCSVMQYWSEVLKCWLKEAVLWMLKCAMWCDIDLIIVKSLDLKKLSYECWNVQHDLILIWCFKEHRLKEAVLSMLKCAAWCDTDLIL